MLQQVIHIELGPASHYFSTILISPPKRRLYAPSFFALISPLTVISMAESHLFPVFCYSLSRSSLINKRGCVLSCISIDDSISRFNSSIFPSPKYFSRCILCTFNCYQYSNISILTTATSTIFTVQISKFVSWGINKPAFAWSVSRADIAPDEAYLTRINQVSSPSLAFVRFHLMLTLNLPWTSIGLIRKEKEFFFPDIWPWHLI